MFCSFGVLLKQQRKGECSRKGRIDWSRRGCTNVSKRWRRPRCLRNQTVRNKRKIIRGKPLKCFWGAYCYPSCRKTWWEDQLSPPTKKTRAHWLLATALLNAVHTLKSEWPWGKSQIQDHSESKNTEFEYEFFCLLLFVGSLHLLRI